MIQPVVRRVSDAATQENFQRITDSLARTNAVNNTEAMSVDLIAGDNAITTPGTTRANGRIIVFQSAASTLYDKGLDDSGRWVINSSAPCTVRLIFV